MTKTPLEVLHLPLGVISSLREQGIDSVETLASLPLSQVVCVQGVERLAEEDWVGRLLEVFDDSPALPPAMSRRLIAVRSFVAAHDIRTEVSVEQVPLVEIGDQTAVEAAPSKQGSRVLGYTLEEQVSKWLASLSRRWSASKPDERVQNVIRWRYGLEDGQVQTLDEIGERLGLSGERVRQIVVKVLGQLGHHSRQLIVCTLADHIRQALLQAGGLATETQLGEALSRIVEKGNANPEAVVRLVLDTHGNFVWVKAISAWGLANLPLTLIPDINLRITQILGAEHVPVSLDRLVDRLKATAWCESQAAGSDDAFLTACIRTCPQITIDGNDLCGLVKWNRHRTDEIIMVLRELGKPAHYSDITDRVNALLPPELRTMPYNVHGELGRNPNLFVPVGEGTFALAEWDLPDDRGVANTAYRVLSEAGRPLSLGILTDQVLRTCGVGRQGELAEPSQADLGEFFGEPLSQRQAEQNPGNSDENVGGFREMEILRNLEAKWSACFSGDDCPPVLGLAALSEEESEIIHQIVEAELSQCSRPQLRTLFALLHEFPACLAVWLARKAGEAYEAGAFWEKFGALIGLTKPINQRDEFAERFRGTCRKTMAIWLPPEELGGHSIVAEFLHQAALPLDRCDSFAQHVRKVERSFGLPDADAPDAGELLREAVLDSLKQLRVPTLKRALRGPAGPRICEVALKVVLKGDFSGINPRLGQELERVFGHAGRGTLHRSAHQPFLRLGEDVGSLEIVGPRQDGSLVGTGGLTWVVDGRRFPTLRSEEFVLPVTDRPRVVLELAGPALSALPPRTFVLRLDDLAEPYILFDERNRRQRRTSGSLPAGHYWLLHRGIDTLTGAEQRYGWSDGDRALSLFEVRPGAEVKLESGSGGPWGFTAALTPFFDAVGERLVHQAAEPVCFGWSEMPFIWLPAEETDLERATQWCVHLRDGDVGHAWRLTRTDDEAGGMVKCGVESGDLLDSLSPGLHRIELVLRRREGGRVEARADYWYWQGLVRPDIQGFHVAAVPENLLQAECCGFGFGNMVIYHLSDQHRCHTLTFDVGGTGKAFHWSQPGVFLESLERRAGRQAVPRSHHLGEAFSASLNSDRWLRIWLAGQAGWEIVVAGQPGQRDIGGDRREFAELSLASLATAFPQGGDIRLRLGGCERLIARFTSPLQPVALAAVGDEAHKGLRFHFAEPLAWMRPVLRELASGQRRTLDGQQFGTSGHCVFATEDLPQIECSSVVDETAPGTAFGHSVTLNVTKQGWPEGLWLVELEVRRDELADWESVALHGRERTPVVILARGGQALTTTRTRLFWQSWNPEQAQSPDFRLDLDESGRTELFELLVDLIDLRKQDMVYNARMGMPQLKDAVRSLSRLAGRMARLADGSGLQTQLLNLACQDSSHEGFVHLPGLLALPAGEYRELPSGDTLNDALRRCGRLTAADTVAEAVRCDPTFLDLGVTSCFGNFGQVAGATNGEPSAAEFSCFAHERYWESVLGTPQSKHLVPDWSGEGALGKAHFVWALDELVRRYEQPTDELSLGSANALLHCSPQFRMWLDQHLAGRAVMSTAAWNAPWPRFAAPEADFLEAAPRFASLFALAARAAAAGLLDFDEAFTWLEHHVEHRSMAEQGVAVLVGLAPELFGHQLLFWELMIRTLPHA